MLCVLSCQLRPRPVYKDYTLFRKMIKKINGEDWELNLHVDGSRRRT